MYKRQVHQCRDNNDATGVLDLFDQTLKEDVLVLATLRDSLGITLLEANNVADGIAEKTDATPSPQLGKAARILLTRKLNAELRWDLEHLKRLLGRNAKQQKCISIGRPFGRSLIGGRTKPIRIYTNHQHRDGDLGEGGQSFRLIRTQRSARGNTIGFRPKRRQQPPGDTNPQHGRTDTQRTTNSGWRQPVHFAGPTAMALSFAQISSS